MSTNWGQVIDNVYQGQHQRVPPEEMRIIGTALLRSEQGKSAEEISSELKY